MWYKSLQHTQRIIPNLSMKQGSLFCFVMVRSPKLWHLMSCSWYLRKAFDEQGCTNLVWDHLALHCASYWLLKHFLNENQIKFKLKTVLEFGAFLVHLESCQQVRFNGVYFTIFRTKVWKILLFEWILLLKIQTNCKNWVWKEKSVEPSMCSHMGQWHKLH